MIDKDIVQEELERKKDRYTDRVDKLENDAVVDDAIPVLYGLLGGVSEDVAICQVILQCGDSRSWFECAARHFITKIDKVEEYADVIAKSNLWHRPTHCLEALRAAVLSGEQSHISAAVERTYATDIEWVLSEREDYEHVVYHVFGLATYLDGDEERAREWADKLAAVDHGYDRYTGLERALDALLERDAAGLAAAIEILLEAHHEKYGPNPDTATGFICLEAAVYLTLAEEAGLSVDLDGIDEPYSQYLPSSPPN